MTAPSKSDLLESLRGSAGEVILAHIASIEWTYPRLIDLATPPPPEESKSTEPPTRSARGGINSYNDRETLIKTLDDADEDMFQKEVKSSGGFVGPLSQVLQWVAVDHVRMHLHDIVEGRLG